MSIDFKLDMTPVANKVVVGLGTVTMALYLLTLAVLFAPEPSIPQAFVDWLAKQ